MEGKVEEEASETHVWKNSDGMVTNCHSLHWKMGSVLSMYSLRMFFKE